MPDNTGPPNVQESSRTRLSAEALVALIMTLASLAWFLGRLSPGIAFGPWQGAFLSDEPIRRLPLLSQWIAGWLGLIPFSDPAVALNVVTAVFAALACGLVAAAATRLGRGLASPFEAGATGMAAAAFFATTPLLTYAGTGTSPTTLSAFLGLAAVLMLILGLKEDASFRYVIASAVLAGLAATNHPSLGLLFFVLAGAMLLLPRGNHSVAGVLLLGLVFLLMASLPLVHSLSQGESLRQFLSHALLTPYPNPGDGVPDFGYGRRLLLTLTPLVVAFAAVGLLRLFHPQLRRYTTVAAAVFLIMGPFLPALVNQDSGPEILYDPEAPRLLAVAMVCLLAGLGALSVVRLLSSSQQTRPHRLALLLALTAVVLVLQTRNAPDRRQTIARDLAHEILQGCPKDALLVSGDPTITSILTASQQVYGLQPDVDVLPAEFLTRSRYRTQLHERLASRANLSAEFPSDEAVSRWTDERPLVFDRLLKQGGDLLKTPEALDLALWDLVMDNPERWPICFIAVPSDWLMARAQLSGPVLCYPRRSEPPSQGFLDLMKKTYQDDSLRRDPGIAEAFASILIPSAEALGRQHSDEDSRQMLELAELLGGDRARVRLALSRSAARQGNRQEAARHALEYLAAADATIDEQNALSAALDADMRAAVLRTRFRQVVGLAREGKPDNLLREEITTLLWQEDDIGALAEGYRAFVQADPDDFTALYHYAGALTQLGQLPEAQSALSRAAVRSPAGIGKRLEEEAARFTLLRVYHSLHASDASK